jgi:hypothetical protein
VFKSMNKDLVEKRGMRMLSVTYYGKRHLTTGKKEVKSVADMKGFKLRVPPVDTFRAMAEAWGAQADPDQLQRALSGPQPGRGGRAGESAADHPERQAQRGAEVPRAHRPHHHAATGHGQRGASSRSSRPKPTAPLDAAVDRRRREMAGCGTVRQEGTLVDTFKKGRA